MKVLNNICWSHLKDMDDIDSIVLHWNKLFMNVVDTHVPLKIKRVKHKYQPDWFSADILQAIQERDQFNAFRKSTKTVPIQLPSFRAFNHLSTIYVIADSVE